jgi:hypothetical protein
MIVNQISTLAEEVVGGQVPRHLQAPSFLQGFQYLPSSSGSNPPIYTVWNRTAYPVAEDLRRIFFRM